MLVEIPHPQHSAISHKGDPALVKGSKVLI